MQQFHHHTTYTLDSVRVCVYLSLALILCASTSHTPLPFRIFHGSVCMFYFSLVRSFASHFTVGGQDSCHSSIHLDLDTQTHIVPWHGIYCECVYTQASHTFALLAPRWRPTYCNSLESLLSKMCSVHRDDTFLGTYFFSISIFGRCLSRCWLGFFHCFILNLVIL